MQVNDDSWYTVVMNKYIAIAIILATAACGGSPTADLGAPAPIASAVPSSSALDPTPTPAPSSTATAEPGTDAGDPPVIITMSDGGSTIPEAGTPDVGTSVTDDAATDSGPTDPPDSAIAGTQDASPDAGPAPIPSFTCSGVLTLGDAGTHSWGYAYDAATDAIRATVDTTTMCAITHDITIGGTCPMTIICDPTQTSECSTMQVAVGPLSGETFNISCSSTTCNIALVAGKFNPYGAQVWSALPCN